ncbi:MAG: putative bifunctional diguanylate cyclase/phosphodiesterase [Xanthobacteraceae bacterium]
MWQRIDWQRPEVRDGAVIFGAALFIYSCAHFLDLPPHLFQFALDNTAWEVDDFIFVIFVLSIAFAVFSVRRLRDLSREIAARRKAELAASKLARHDTLTGLPNRRYFVEKLGEILAKTTEKSRSALLLLDLDGFKSINDEHGHAAGDQALVEFAKRVTGVLRPGAVLARLGGDEFAVIVPDIGTLDDSTALARRIVSTVAEPFTFTQPPAELGVGIGIAIAPGDGITAEVLTQHADRALYRAKADGRSRVRFFELDMNAHIARRTAVERELRAAIAGQTIVPYYQPIAMVDDGHIIGFEALARWHIAQFGWVEPRDFITIAEECGVISQLGDQLLRQACRDAQSWPADITLSFNISAIQLRDPTLGLRILAILGETGFNPHRLELEITETALVDNISVARVVIDQLRQTGVRIALDDFGTGYSTLSQLLTFQLDRIKIDRSFVDRLGKDKESATMVAAILGLARGFGLATTAEGVENSAQLESLRATGCLEGQGFLFGKAVPARDVADLLSLSGTRESVVA